MPVVGFNYSEVIFYESFSRFAKLKSLTIKYEVIFLCGTIGCLLLNFHCGFKNLIYLLLKFKTIY